MRRDSANITLLPVKSIIYHVIDGKVEQRIADEIKRSVVDVTRFVTDVSNG